MTITAERPATSDFAAARRAMIDSQLRVSGVTQDFVLAAMARVPREDFVPGAARGHAYIDRAIPLGRGHALPSPLVHGMLLAEAAPTLQDNILVVTCGSGYLAALFEGLAGSVTAVEAVAAETAKRRKGGYSLLVIEGAVELLPASLASLLADGGRVVTGIVEGGVTRLARGQKLGGAIALQPLADIGMPILAEFAAPRKWSF